MMALTDRRNRAPLALGLGYKLVVAPALLGILYFGLVGLSDGDMRVTVLGPQIGGAIVKSVRFEPCARYDDGWYRDDACFHDGAMLVGIADLRQLSRQRNDDISPYSNQRAACS